MVERITNHSLYLELKNYANDTNNDAKAIELIIACTKHISELEYNLENKIEALDIIETEQINDAKESNAKIDNIIAILNSMKIK